MFWGFQTLLCQQLQCPSHVTIAQLMSVTVLSLQTRFCFLSVTSLSLHRTRTWVSVPLLSLQCVIVTRDRRYVTIATAVRKFVTKILKSAKWSVWKNRPLLLAKDANIQFSKCLIILWYNQKMLDIWWNGKESVKFLLNFLDYLCLY